MSEKLHPRHEQHESDAELHEHKQHTEHLHPKHEQNAKATKHEHAERLDDIRKEAEAAATKTSETLKKHTSHETAAKTENIQTINRELKDMAYRRTLTRTRRHLSAPSRAFSKVIHQPIVENVSEVASKTVARPSGILAGGIAAFLGSSLFLWIARHYGYEYNFLLFALLFVSGFFMGLLVELGLRAASRQR